MKYYKAKFLKQGKPTGRAYTYKSQLELTPGELVELPGGSHGVVLDEPVDMEWVETYCSENLKEIMKKYEPEESGEREDKENA